MTDLVCAQAIFDHFNKHQTSTVAKIYLGAQGISRCADLPGPDNDKIAIYLTAFKMEKELLIDIENKAVEDKAPIEAVRTVAGPILLSAEANLTRVLVLAEKHHYKDLKDEVDVELLGANSYAQYLQTGTGDEATQ